MRLTKIDGEGGRYAKGNGKWVKITRRNLQDYIVDTGFEGDAKRTHTCHAPSLKLARAVGSEWIEK